MATLVIEHIKASDLPAQWALKLNAAPEQTVTVRIETEASSEAAGKNMSTSPPEIMDDLLFGMWRDREDMADVPAYIRKLRAPRYHHDGSRNTTGKA